jgi:hypothetical protein
MFSLYLLPRILYQLISPKPNLKLTLETGKLTGDDDTTATATTGLSTLTPGSGLKTTSSSRSGTFVKNMAVAL